MRRSGRRGGARRRRAAVMKLWRSECGDMRFTMPARRATRRTIRVAPCRSRRRPERDRRTGPLKRSPQAKSMARLTRGGSGMTATLPPLPTTVTVRWPRSEPRCSMSIGHASDTRSPSNPSRQARAWSVGPAAAAWAMNAPSSMRSSPSVVDSVSIFGRRTCSAGDSVRYPSTTAKR